MITTENSAWMVFKEIMTPGDHWVLCVSSHMIITGLFSSINYTLTPHWPESLTIQSGFCHMTPGITVIWWSLLPILICYSSRTGISLTNHHPPQSQPSRSSSLFYSLHHQTIIRYQILVSICCCLFLLVTSSLPSPHYAWDSLS